MKNQRTMAKLFGKSVDRYTLQITKASKIIYPQLRSLSIKIC